MAMQSEIIKVQELTGAAEEQIILHDDGYWSRAYVVNGGEFVVKFPKHDDVSYESEAKFLNLLNSVALPVNMQKVKWLAEDNRCIAIFGVKGTPHNLNLHICLSNHDSSLLLNIEKRSYATNPRLTETCYVV